MITLYRPAYYRAYRVPRYAGLSTDIKPVDVQNGARFIEIDTGAKYAFDASTGTWHTAKHGNILCKTAICCLSRRCILQHKMALF